LIQKLIKNQQQLIEKIQEGKAFSYFYINLIIFENKLNKNFFGYVRMHTNGDKGS
jgi:hypothetical protein